MTSWTDEFISIAAWALQAEDLRHRYIYSRSGRHLASTPGIAKALETSVILAVYQAALGKGYIEGDTIDYERPYPGYDGQNPPRADLAFKKRGPGQNWAYVEAKHYRVTGRRQIAADIEKLRSITQRSQRWIFAYRVRRTDGHAHTLEELLVKSFPDILEIHGSASFLSVPIGHDSEGACDLCLARVR